MLKTLANGIQRGRANTSVSGRSAGSATTMLFVAPVPGPPTDASAAGSAGMYPPLATIAARLHEAPMAMMAIPGISRLRRTAARTRAVEAT